MTASYVHDPELNILKSVLERSNFDGSLFRGLRGDYFRDAEYGQAWDYLCSHYRTYGQVPAKETFLADHEDLRDYILTREAPEPPQFYADHILESYARSGLAQELTEAVPGLAGDVREAIGDLKGILSTYELARANVDILNLQNTGRERLDEYNKPNLYGIPWGWETLDDATMGAHPGDLVLTVARPGLGKSWTMMKNAYTAWDDDARVLVIATEVPSVKMFQRFDAIHLGLDYELFKKQLLTSDLKRRYEEFALEEDPSKERFMSVNGTGMTPSALNVLIEQTEPDIVYIDSVHKLEPDQRYREGWEKFRHLANELKDTVAQAKQIPVVCNTHFNRDIGSQFGNRKNIEGGLEHVAGGDEWGKVADLVLGLSRSAEETAQQALKMRVIKGREAADGITFHIDFDFKTMSLHEKDILYPEEDQIREEEDKDKGLKW